MLNSFLSETPQVGEVILLAIIALLGGGLFSFLYVLLKRKETFYKDMAISFTLFPFLVAIACLGVSLLTAAYSGDQLTARFGRVAVALLGAVLILRFRSEQRNFEDLTYLFFLTIYGLLIGSGYLYLGLAVEALILGVMALFHLLGWPKPQRGNMLLSITVPEDLDYPNAFEDVFAQYADSHHLVAVKSADLGSVFILKYEVRLKKGASQKEFLDAVRTRNSNLNISLALHDFKVYR